MSHHILKTLKNISHLFKALHPSIARIPILIVSMIRKLWQRQQEAEVAVKKKKKSYYNSSLL